MPIAGKPILNAAALILLGLGLALPAAAASADLAPSAAVSVVEALDAELIEAMKNARALGPKGRYERLEPAMAAAFDMAELTRRESSSRWSRLSDDQKARLIVSVAAFETSLYADWFDVYVGQSFRVTGSTLGADGTTIVNTVMSGGDVPPLSLDYLLQAGTEGRWHIVDVRYAGWFSVVERRRSEFSVILDRNGVDALIAKLDSRRQVALGHADNIAAPHLLQPRTDQWSMPVYPLN